MSHPENQTPSPTRDSSDGPRAESSALRLKRETILMSSDRGRLGLLVALCSLAGVVVGFGISNMAVMRAHHCPTMTVTSVPSAAPVDTPTWLGVRISDAREGGALVQKVEAGSPAADAGLRRGDVVTGVSRARCGRRFSPITRASDLVRTVRSRDAGDSVRIRLLRDGDTYTLRARLGQMPVPLFLEEIR
ncbi:PDZ domain-containing protein [Haliangium sp.]|uniref:PDZ domain-containing protein n=1 Tax=Haliangium sp. TaxID=2663208 RepID=UPI003D116FBE